MIIKTVTYVGSREGTGRTQKRELGQKQTVQKAWELGLGASPGKSCLFFPFVSGSVDMAPLRGLKQMGAPP